MQSHWFTFGVPVKERLWDQVLVNSDTTGSRAPIASAWHTVQSLMNSTVPSMCCTGSITWFEAAQSPYPGWQRLQLVLFGCVPAGGLPWQLAQVSDVAFATKAPAHAVVLPAEGVTADVSRDEVGEYDGASPPALEARTRSTYVTFPVSPLSVNDVAIGWPTWTHPVLPSRERSTL